MRLREPKLGLCDNLEEWDGVGGGREVQEGGDMYTPMADFMLLYGRNQHNIVKQLSSNKKFKTKKEYWNKLPFPLPWDLPNPGIIEPESPSLQADSSLLPRWC